MSGGLPAIVPDVAEPIVGWRVWLLRESHDGWMLVSVNHQLWEPGKKLSAYCLAGNDSTSCPDHLAPSSSCRCGIYATRDETTIRALLRAPAPPLLVVGRVALWGRVVGHQIGYRAELAYPMDLTLLLAPGAHIEDEKLQHLERFGVPVRTEEVAAWVRPRPRVETPASRTCGACQIPLAASGECTNADHAYLAHRRWKKELKAKGEWTFKHVLDDLIDPPPRRGQSLEDAQHSLRNEASRMVIYALSLGGFAAVMAGWLAFEQLVLGY